MCTSPEHLAIECMCTRAHRCSFSLLVSQCVCTDARDILYVLAYPKPEPTSNGALYIVFELCVPAHSDVIYSLSEHMCINAQWYRLHQNQSRRAMGTLHSEWVTYQRLWCFFIKWADRCVPIRSESVWLLSTLTPQTLKHLISQYYEPKDKCYEQPYNMSQMDFLPVEGLTPHPWLHEYILTITHLHPHTMARHSIPYSPAHSPPPSTPPSATTDAQALHLSVPRAQRQVLWEALQHVSNGFLRVEGMQHIRALVQRPIKMAYLLRC